MENEKTTAKEVRELLEEAVKTGRSKSILRRSSKNEAYFRVLVNKLKEEFPGIDFKARVTKDNEITRYLFVEVLKPIVVYSDFVQTAQEAASVGPGNQISQFTYEEIVTAFNAELERIKEHVKIELI